LEFTLPLTPALSPGEREKLWHSPGIIKSLRLNPADGSWKGSNFVTGMEWLATENSIEGPVVQNMMTGKIVHRL